MAVSAGFLAGSFYKLRQALTEKVFVAKKQLAVADGPSVELGTGQKSILTKTGKEKIELMIMLGSLVFVFQLIDFPILNFGIGHLLGGALLALVLGPWAGIVIMSLILIIQSLVLADGGIMALGANFLNIGLVTVVSSHLFYKLGLKLKFPQLGVLFVACLASVVLASLFYVLTVGVAGINHLTEVFNGMVKAHFIIGVFESLVTIIIIKTLKLKMYLQ